MARTLRIAAVQAAPYPLGGTADRFAEDVRQRLATDPGIDLIVYPELHLFDAGEARGDDRHAALRAAAVTLDDPFVAALGDIARRNHTWLIPGSICEAAGDGAIYNTALVFSPDGDLVAHYRKIFPWRPYEPYLPGDRFVTVDLPGIGRLGLSICYDAWFPEVTRHLAWMGADVVINIVKTTTPDRAQEVVLARANSIVNQTFTVSVNCAGPVGEGRSVIVDPEGAILRESLGTAPTALVDTLDLSAIDRVREAGTAGFNRMWSQILPTDAPIDLPLYGGAIEPARWHPLAASHPSTSSTGTDFLT
jgi:predicted amidohydrolase